MTSTKKEQGIDVNTSLDRLIEIFAKTFEDRKFSRSEKKALSQLLADDYCLNKNQRDQVRSKLFDMARAGIGGHENRWIIDWLETANRLLLNRQDTNSFFSPGEECREEIIKRLDRATTSVDICVYTISDDIIAKAIARCHRRKVKVRIITDDEKVNDRGSDIWELTAYGIKTKTDDCPNYMHHKFAIFDNDIVLTGSYNWTRGAAEFNQENLLVTDEKRTVDAYIAEFERLWDCMKPLNIPGRG
jgi:HKD family nuclease